MKRRSRSLRLAAGVSLALLTGLLFAATASAHEPLDDGAYQVVLPDGTSIDFTLSDAGQTLAVTDMPATFTTETNEDTTVISNGTVRVEIKTGEKGEIEVSGLDFVVGSTASAQLPNAAGTTTVVVLSNGIDVLLPTGWTVEDLEDEGQNIEVRITDGTVTYELEVDLEDGTIEIKRVDDDDDSSDGASNEGSEDDQSDDTSDDSASLDDVSDDDDSSVESTTSTSTSSTTSTSTTTTVADDDASSDDASSDDASGDDKSDDKSDDTSDDDSGSND